MIEPGDHSTVVKDGSSERIVLGRRSREADCLVFRDRPLLIAWNSDLIPYLDDISGPLEHAAFLLDIQVSVVPDTSGMAVNWIGPQESPVGRKLTDSPRRRPR